MEDGQRGLLKILEHGEKYVHVIKAQIFFTHKNSHTHTHTHTHTHSHTRISGLGNS